MIEVLGHYYEPEHLKELPKFWDNGFILFSVFEYGLPLEVNQKRHEALKYVLREAGLYFYEVAGKYCFSNNHFQFDNAEEYDLGVFIPLVLGMDGNGILRPYLATTTMLEKAYHVSNGHVHQHGDVGSDCVFDYVEAIERYCRLKGYEYKLIGVHKPTNTQVAGAMHLYKIKFFGKIYDYELDGKVHK